MRQKTKFFYPNYKFQKKHFSHKWHPSKFQKINTLIALIDNTSQQTRRKFIIVTPPYAAIVIKWPFQKKRRNLKIRERELSYLTWINNILMNIQFIKKINFEEKRLYYFYLSEVMKFLLCHLLLQVCFNWGLKIYSWWKFIVDLIWIYYLWNCYWEQISVFECLMRVRFY